MAVYVADPAAQRAVLTAAAARPLRAAGERVKTFSGAVMVSDGHVKTGRALGSFYVTASPGRVEIGNTAPYFAYLELGTQPHTITGRPMLVFYVGGRKVFAKQVKHPGNEPYRILTRALEQVVRGVLV